MSDTKPERPSLRGSDFEGVLFDEMVVELDFVAREHAKTGVFCPFGWQAFQPLCLTGPTFMSQIPTFTSQTSGGGHKGCQWTHVRVRTYVEFGHKGCQTSDTNPVKRIGFGHKVWQRNEMSSVCFRQWRHRHPGGPRVSRPAAVRCVGIKTPYLRFCVRALATEPWSVSEPSSSVKLTSEAPVV